VTAREAAIVMAYTEVAIGDFATFHAYAQEKLGRWIRVHEFANRAVIDELKRACYDDFLALSHEAARDAA
jgi:hypothetical protein